MGAYKIIKVDVGPIKTDDRMSMCIVHTSPVTRKIAGEPSMQSKWMQRCRWPILANLKLQSIMGVTVGSKEAYHRIH
jgi:hypothetical protein